ncbi:hypothetical protein M422DRAFT_35241 [Sphaerobolus stellatus SS14]|uniref:Uncharacterized protein n=1 Tax=Sphaerobolus stellatus (strain SS14) TaxID=990650 RepID=A0A0C9UGY1_SPHS4|nr:hypothetical protein M422DRAFT_35241 [Sphaerobolus stellatus SS14]
MKKENIKLSKDGVRRSVSSIGRIVRLYVTWMKMLKKATATPGEEGADFSYDRGEYVLY